GARSLERGGHGVVAGAHRPGVPAPPGASAGAPAVRRAPRRARRWPQRAALPHGGRRLAVDGSPALAAGALGRLAGARRDPRRVGGRAGALRSGGGVRRARPLAAGVRRDRLLRPPAGVPRLRARRPPAHPRTASRPRARSARLGPHLLTRRPARAGQLPRSRARALQDRDRPAAAGYPRTARSTV
ncbi:MAG: FIG01201438: hypothetical protein, partial [uncultured Solirubrobacteraceae bacterium]